MTQNGFEGPAAVGGGGDIGGGDGDEGGDGGDGADEGDIGGDNNGQPVGQGADVPGDQQPPILNPARRLAGARAALAGALRGGGSTKSGPLRGAWLDVGWVAQPARHEPCVQLRRVRVRWGNFLPKHVMGQIHTL